MTTNDQNVFKVTLEILDGEMEGEQKQLDYISLKTTDLKATIERIKQNTLKVINDEKDRLKRENQPPLELVEVKMTVQNITTNSSELKTRTLFGTRYKELKTLKRSSFWNDEKIKIVCS